MWYARGATSHSTLVTTPKMKYVQKLSSGLVGKSPVMRTMASENEAKKGIGSNVPKQCVKHFEGIVEHNPAIKPAEALRNVKAALCPLEHDKVNQNQS